jgi:outer membrane autotransporter protein
LPGLGGVQAGYNWQAANAVLGVEADWAWTGFDEDRYFDGADRYVKAEMDWLATLRGRLGVTVGNALFYATGGIAWADVSHCANDDDPCSVDDSNNTAWSGTLTGLVAGAGVETKLTDRWSLKGEYLYAQFGKENVIYDWGDDYDIDFSDRAHIFRIGLNYKFGG